MSRYEPRINKEGDYFYALIVRVDADGEESVIRGYKGRHFKTKEGAIKSTAKHIKEFNLDEEQQYKVTKDGKERFAGTSNECFVYILKNQSQSVDWACKYEGWKIELKGVKAK
jgi:hypothetical protein